MRDLVERVSEIKRPSNRTVGLRIQVNYIFSVYAPQVVCKAQEKQDFWGRKNWRREGSAADGLSTGGALMDKDGKDFSRIHGTCVIKTQGTAIQNQRPKYFTHITRIRQLLCKKRGPNFVLLVWPLSDFTALDCRSIAGEHCMPVSANTTVLNHWEENGRTMDVETRGKTGEFLGTNCKKVCCRQIIGMRHICLTTHACGYSPHFWLPWPPRLR